MHKISLYFFKKVFCIFNTRKSLDVAFAAIMRHFKVTMIQHKNFLMP